MSTEETIEFDIITLARRAYEICNKKNWGRDWSKGGCYLHLEASEFIESLRGKGLSEPEEEAADVLFVLLTMMQANEVSFEGTLKALENTVERLEFEVSLIEVENNEYS